MWLIVQWISPDRPLDLWILALPMVGWAAFYSWCFGNDNRIPMWWARQIPGTLMWTDILNLVTVDVFNSLPIWWWAHGWTISMLPFIGRFTWTLPIWIIVLWLFGPTLVFTSGVGFNL
jgi:hypothetical protein